MSLSPDELTRSHQEFLEEVKALPRGGDLEALIERQIARTSRHLYQAALETRGEQPATSEDSEVFSPAICPDCECVLGKARLMPRRIRTLYGELCFPRAVRECPCCRRSFAELDRELGLPANASMPLSVIQKVVYATAHASFSEASRHLKHQLNLEVSSAQCQRLAQSYGERLDTLRREREALASRAPVARNERRVVLEADATSVLTQAGEEHKMVQVGTGFALEDRVRKPGRDDASPGRALLATRRYAGEADFETFETSFAALATRVGAYGAQAVAFIGDGARCLWGLAEDVLPPGTVFIQDFWHVCEHLYAAAATLYPRDEEHRKAQGARWKEMLRASRVQDILEELRSARRRLRGARRQALDGQIGYLEAGRSRMDYARYAQEDWPIGSGAVEGSCKHVVKERFHVTGARWKRDQIQNILALRLSIFNEEWNEDWRAIRKTA